MAGKDHQIIALTEAQISAAGALLAEAFFTDHLMMVLFPDAQERRDVLTWYYTETVRELVPSQKVYTTVGTVNGVAVWLPPGAPEEAPQWHGQSSGEAYERFLNMNDYLAPLRQAAMPDAFWYLPWIGVAETHQRQGLGSALLAPGLMQADQAGLPCYLETFHQPNLLFYRQHGFEVVVNQVEPGRGVEFWTMKREPRNIS